MGVGFSGLVIDENSGSPSKLGLADLPESCVALVLSYLEPAEICRLACLNRTFRQASIADAVWESKLPENYQILARKLFADGSSETTASKKQIFRRLCCPNHFDCNTKEVRMDKNGGQICVAISWKGLKITGIADRRYWNHISTDESRTQIERGFRVPWYKQIPVNSVSSANMVARSRGGLDFEFPPATYSLFFRLQLGRTSRRLGRRRVCNMEQVHGWNLKPVKFKLSLPNGQHVTSQYFLNEVDGQWKEYYVGDFVVDNAETPTNLKFSMTQIDCTHSKGGLCLDCVLIYPSKIGERQKQLQF